MTRLEKHRNGHSGDPLKIFTWHIHGSYLYYLSQSKNEFYLPVKEGNDEGYGGRAGSFAWGENVHEVPVQKVKDMDFDCILYQSRKSYLEDRFEILSKEQLDLPSIYLEHDPPRENPTDTKHLVDDPNTVLVHVTAFNQLMWDNNSTPTRVIDHGVVVPEGIQYTGEIPRGIVVVNNLYKRGRRLGLDIFDYVKERVPLDLVGINSEKVGGLGSIGLDEVIELESHYRFFFNPIRYTSLGLAVCEAMMIGMPIVGLATTEMVTTVENDISGYLDTNIDHLIEKMHLLIENPDQANYLSKGSAEKARRRFNIQRFAEDWDDLFREITGRRSPALMGNTNIYGEEL